MAAIKFKPLEWGTYKALGVGQKLLAFDPFGNEFARIDLAGQSKAYIEKQKSLAEGRYQAKMREAIHTLRDHYPGMPVEPDETPDPGWPIKRYDASAIMMSIDSPEHPKPSPNGSWMRYEDHARVIRKALLILNAANDTTGA